MFKIQKLTEKLFFRFGDSQKRKKVGIFRRSKLNKKSISIVLNHCLSCVMWNMFVAGGQHTEVRKNNFFVFVLTVYGSSRPFSSVLRNSYFCL